MTAWPEAEPSQAVKQPRSLRELAQEMPGFFYWLIKGHLREEKRSTSLSSTLA